MDVGHRLLQILHPGSAGWSMKVRTPLALLIGGVAQLAALMFRGVMRHLITERMMTLALPPAAVIHLGRNLDGEYPVVLREPRNTALLELLTRFAPADGVATDVGAYDWSVLEQRMRLITRLFRLRHEDALLFTDPYTLEQVAAFEAGRLPDGEL